MVYFLALLIFPIAALVIDFYKCDEMYITININLLNSNYFKMGMFHEPSMSSEHKIDTLTIGMLLVEIEFTFFKELEG